MSTLKRNVRPGNIITLLATAATIAWATYLSTQFSPNAILATLVSTAILFTYFTWSVVAKIQLTPVWLLGLMAPLMLSILLWVFSANSTMRAFSNISGFITFLILPIAFLKNADHGRSS